MVPSHPALRAATALTCHHNSHGHPRGSTTPLTTYHWLWPLPTPQVGVCLCPGGQSTPPPHGDGYGAAPCTWWKPSKLINTPIFSLQFLTQIHICSCQLVAAKMGRRCQNRPLHPPFRLESHHGWCIESPKSQLSMRGRLATSVYPQNTHPPLCPFSRGVEGVRASQGACGVYLWWAVWLDI